MTLEQLLSPAVWEWCQENEHLPKEQMLNEFDKWLVKNEELINESVKNNYDKINEYIEYGKNNTRIILENNDDEIDYDNMDFDDFEVTTKKEDEPISGEVESEDSSKTEEPEETIAGKVILRDPEKAPTPHVNVYTAINSLYKYLEDHKALHLKNTVQFSRFDMSKVTDATALFAFADIPNADLSSWNMSKVKTMEGMFYKSTFNNDSICGWDVSSCTSFLRMFTFSDFNQSLSKWKPGYITKDKLDKDGNPIPDGKGGYEKERIPANLPLIGHAQDEEAAMIQNYWFDKFDETPIKESKENTIKTMKHILDFETFVNEGFGDFIKKGINKVKSFFKNMVVKFNNFIAMFDDKGEVIDASSPYTALNFISDGEVQGVTAFTAVKNEYLNDNVQSTASIVESPEYYGIVDKNSLEYRNYLTMVDMVNEHYAKYGEKLNEAAGRVGFSGEDGGLKGIRDIKSNQLKFLLDQAIKNVPAYKGKNAGGAVLIWGAPGIGKSTIPKAIINEWNENHTDKKSIMVVECGDLTVDGFSLPLPMTKTMGEYMKEHPEVQRRLISQGYDVTSKDFLNQEIKVSGEALKTWLPMYKLTASNERNKINDAVANGRVITKYDDEGQMDTIETTEGGIILFDEFFRANESIFKILMQLLLNRTFNNGEYMLGSKWAIIACSNRPNDDEEVARGFESTGAVVGTRFGGGQFNFIPDFDDWKKWAVKDGHFDDATISFLMQSKDASSGEYTNWHTIRPGEYDGGKTAWPTPRTWSMLMVELHNIMENEGYLSVQEIPSDIIQLKADGIIGTEMSEKYIEFLSTFKSKFSPAEVLNNPKYSIPTDMKCSEVIDRLKKYIDTKFDINKLPTEDQIMNMFNILDATFNASKNNYVMPLYAHIFKKFGYLGTAEERKIFTSSFRKFIIAFMKKADLKSPAELHDYLV